MQKREFDLIMDCTKFYDIKSVVSYADASVLKISVFKECFEMKVDISNLDETEKQEFAMAFFEYVPCDNWSGFFEAGYSLEFDVTGGGDIAVFSIGNKK